MADKRKRESKRAPTPRAKGKRKRPIAEAQQAHADKIREHFSSRRVKDALSKYATAAARLAALPKKRRDRAVDLREELGAARLASGFTEPAPLARTEALAFVNSPEVRSIARANLRVRDALRDLDHVYRKALGTTRYVDLQGLLPVKLDELAAVKGRVDEFLHVFDVFGIRPDVEAATPKKGRPPSARGLQAIVEAALEDNGEDLSPAELAEQVNHSRAQVDEALKAVRKNRSREKPPV